MDFCPSILLTNDDGYSAKGIVSLYNALSGDYNVTIVAPEKEQSGVSHAFTYNGPICSRPIYEETGLNGYAVSGTPSDCVKFGIANIFSTRPDLIVSGINIGENSGTAGYYSGTVAAAREGAMWGIRSMAFSACMKGAEYLPEYAIKSKQILQVISEIHNNGFVNCGNRIFFNVNFPECGPAMIKGIKITAQSLAFFNDRYELKDDSGGKREFWLSGEKREAESSNIFDSRAVEEGYIAVTPLNFDATDHLAVKRLNELEMKL